MPKLFLAIFAMATLILASCTTNDVDDPIIEPQRQTLVNLHLDFTTTETAWNAPAKTRALSATESEVTRIALTIFDASGNKALGETQYKTDEHFGTFTDLRLLPGTYTFAIVAHRASTTDEAPATITSATSATLAGDYLLDTYTTTKSVTITANAAQDVPITVPLCVTKLRIESLDIQPSDVATIRITTLPEGATSPEASGSATTFSPTTGLLPSATSFTRTWAVSSNVGKKIALNFFFMADAFPHTCDILVEALNSEGSIITSRTYSGITFNRAKVRTIQTYLFSGNSSTTLTFEEWTSEDPITIE